MKIVHFIYLAIIYWALFLAMLWDTSAAGFATFMTILGRYDSRNAKIDICCSVLEQQSSKGFLTNLVMTFGNFVLGFSKLPYLHTHPHLRRIYYIG